MTPVVVIVTGMPDPSARKVAGMLHERDVRTIQIDANAADDWLPPCFLHRNGNPTLLIEDVGAENVVSVWWRSSLRAAKSSHRSDDSFHKAIQHYCIAQRTSHMLASLLAIPNARHINPLASDRAGSKVWQLWLAKEIGFDIPDTYIGADSARAKRFARSVIDAGKQVISKAYTSALAPVIELEEGLFGRRTMLLHPECLDELDQLGGIPIILQEYVAKQFEVRATVVGGQVFACGIDSQKSERTRVDWRRYDLPNTPHWRYELPPDVEVKLHEFCRRANLIFGAFDLIVTPDGRHIFLEVNPTGQWLWIEDLVGLPISQAIAGELLKPEEAPRALEV